MADLNKSTSQTIALTESQDVDIRPSEVQLTQLVVEVDVLQTDQQRQLFQLVVEVDISQADPYGADAIALTESTGRLIYLPDLLVGEQETATLSEDFDLVFEGGEEPTLRIFPGFGVHIG